MAIAGYCTIDQVCTAFPQFQRNAPGSIQDSDIQGWITDRKARIRSSLLTRGIDPDSLTLSDDQKGFLRSLNRDGGIYDMGIALQGVVTLQPGEYSTAMGHGKSYERVLGEIVNGLHDKLFEPTEARTRDITPLLKGLGGAETDPTDPRPVNGQNRSFWKNQQF